jgi:ABC-2 type transport system permease protein
MSTVAWITARGLLGRRRFLLLFPLPILLVGLAALSRGFGVTSSEWAPAVIYGLGFAVVLPVVALIVGTGVLGAEIDDGTIVHILSKPLPRWRIILPKLFVAAAVTAVTVAIPLYIVGVLAEGVRLGLALVAASAIGALAYTAIFLALSLVTRRPVLLGLVYVLIWEGLLGNIVSGTKSLSVQQYVVTIADWIAATPLLDASVGRVTAVVMSVLVTVGFTWLAIDRLRSFSVAGETG